MRTIQLQRHSWSIKMILLKTSVIFYLATASVFSVSALPKAFFSQIIGSTTQATTTLQGNTLEKLTAETNCEKYFFQSSGKICVSIFLILNFPCFSLWGTDQAMARSICEWLPQRLAHRAELYQDLHPILPHRRPPKVHPILPHRRPPKVRRACISCFWRESGWINWIWGVYSSIFQHNRILWLPRIG